jgi:cell division initiation protein
MTLTTRDIQEKQFHDAFRGYSHEEVDVFIDQVAESFDQLAREKHALNLKIEELQEQLRNAQAQGPDDMLKRLLVTAQETADKAIQNARAKAQGMIEEAENRARVIREQAEALSANRLQEAERRAEQTLASVTSEERDLRSRIDGMKRFEKEFRSRLTAFIRSQLELLEKTSLSQPEVQEDFASAEVRRSFAQPEPMVSSPPMEAAPWDEMGSADPFLPEAEEKESLHLRESLLKLDYPPPRPGDISHGATPETSPPVGEPVSDLLDEERLPHEDAAVDPSSMERGPGLASPAPPPATRNAQPTQPVPAPSPASESRKEKPKDENRSIRELFWGEE